MNRKRRAFRLIAWEIASLKPATIDRWLAPYRKDYPSHQGLSGTKPGTLLKNQILIKIDHCDVNRPGFLEADTVAHCGNSLAGDFVWSITYTDIFSTWTEIRATWNKGSEGVKEQTQRVEHALPFAILGFGCDNVLIWSQYFFSEIIPRAKKAIFLILYPEKSPKWLPPF